MTDKGLKRRLEKYYGERIVCMPQRNGSEFICSSTLNVGDALRKLVVLQEKYETSEDEIIIEAAQILRTKAKECKSKNEYNSCDISSKAAKEIVPQTIFNFTCQLLVDKKLHTENGMTVCSEDTKQKALLLSQQLLYAICSIRSPLTVGMAYDIYNNSRSKSLINLLNKVNLSISYDTFHRELSSLYSDIHRDLMRNSLYLPPNIKHNVFTQFAIDNIDWAEKTKDGSTFHATSAIIIQPPADKANSGITFPKHERIIRSRKKGITEIPVSIIEPCHLSSTDRKKSRSLAGIPSVSSLQSKGTNKIDNLLLLWTMCRMVPTKLLNLTEIMRRIEYQVLVPSVQV